MTELIEGYYAYWLCFLVMVLGLYGMLMKHNLVKKIVGLAIFQAAIVLFFIVAAFKDDATVPVLDSGLEEVAAASYINPLPHTLMLTAIVVGVATVGVAFALVIRIYEGFGTLDEDELLEKMKP